MVKDPLRGHNRKDNRKPGEQKSHRILQRSTGLFGLGNGIRGIRCGGLENGRIVITAHIDSKKGSPGAIDNVTGVVVLLLLADLLKDYSGKRQIEIVAFNGEDYYSVPGQMAWIMANQGKFENILFNINIDGAGYIAEHSCPRC